jgi:spore germination cell wall hydrolase CwlJ-like protein
MSRKTSDVTSRSDRVLVVAFCVVLAAASAAVGAAAADHPGTEQAVVHSTVPAAAKPAEFVAAPASGASMLPAVQQTTRPATAADLAMAQLLAEHRCLSEVMYYEARGEGRDGQLAIAEVVFHRLRHGRYGHSICAVVYEGAGGAGCQFSFTCNGQLTHRKSTVAWRSAEVLAARILAGEITLRDITGDATHFHAVSVSPDWADEMQRTVQIGNHVFYRRARSSSRAL